MTEEEKPKYRTKEGLTDLIESLYSQWEKGTPRDRAFLSEQITKYAMKYKEVTGNWYMRDGSKK